MPYRHCRHALIRTKALVPVEQGIELPDQVRRPSMARRIKVFFGSPCRRHCGPADGIPQISHFLDDRPCNQGPAPLRPVEEPLELFDESVACSPGRPMGLVRIRGKQAEHANPDDFPADSIGPIESSTRRSSETPHRCTGTPRGCLMTKPPWGGPRENKTFACTSAGLGPIGHPAVLRRGACPWPKPVQDFYIRRLSSPCLMSWRAEKSTSMRGPSWR